MSVLFCALVNSSAPTYLAPLFAPVRLSRDQGYSVKILILILRKIQAWIKEVFG